MTLTQHRQAILAAVEGGPYTVSFGGVLARIVPVTNCVRCEVALPADHVCEPQDRARLTTPSYSPRGHHPMKTITLTAELAKDILSGDAPDDCGYKVVADYEIGESRWAVIRTLVIEDADGRFFDGTYRSGTGDSGEMPWEYDDSVTFTEVFACQKVVTEFVKPSTVEADLVSGIDVRACAVAVIENAVEDIDFVGIAEQHEDAWAHLSPEDEERAHRRVDELVRSANVTVTWNDEGAER